MLKKANQPTNALSQLLAPNLLASCPLSRLSVVYSFYPTPPELVLTQLLLVFSELKQEPRAVRVYRTRKHITTFTIYAGEFTFVPFQSFDPCVLFLVYIWGKQ